MIARYGEVAGGGLAGGVVSDCSPEKVGWGHGVEGDSALPDVKSSERKKSLGSTVARGRLANARPKSSLMWMEEIRKTGLRGRALRHSSRMEGSGVKGSKGKKRVGERGSQGMLLLASIPEADAIIGDPIEVVGEVEGVDENGNGVSGSEKEMGMAVGVEGPGGQSVQDILLHGSEIENAEALKLPTDGDFSDLAFDMISTQPLQEMSFVGEQPPLLLERGILGKDSPMEEMVHDKGEKDREQESLPRLDGEADFPPLSKECLRLAKQKDRNRRVGGKAVLGGPEQLSTVKGSGNRGGRFGNSDGKGEDNK